MHEGIEVFREFYPTHQDYIMLECVWQIDKFVLLESTYMNEDSNSAGDGEIALLGAPAIQYRSIDRFLEDECVSIPHKTEMGKAIEQALLWLKKLGLDLLPMPLYLMAMKIG